MKCLTCGKNFDQTAEVPVDESMLTIGHRNCAACRESVATKPQRSLEESLSRMLAIQRKHQEAKQFWEDLAEAVKADPSLVGRVSLSRLVDFFPVGYGLGPSDIEQVIGILAWSVVELESMQNTYPMSRSVEHSRIPFADAVFAMAESRCVTIDMTEDHFSEGGTARFFDLIRERGRVVLASKEKSLAVAAGTGNGDPGSLVYMEGWPLCLVSEPIGGRTHAPCSGLPLLRFKLSERGTAMTRAARDVMATAPCGMFIPGIGKCPQ